MQTFLARDFVIVMITKITVGKIVKRETLKSCSI